MRDWRRYQGIGLPGRTCLNEGLEKVSRYRFTW